MQPVIIMMERREEDKQEPSAARQSSYERARGVNHYYQNNILCDKIMDRILTWTRTQTSARIQKCFRSPSVGATVRLCTIPAYVGVREYTTNVAYPVYTVYYETMYTMIYMRLVQCYRTSQSIICYICMYNMYNI